jgi:hypothetical protein
MSAVLNYPRWIFVISFALLWGFSRLGAYFERTWSPLRTEERETFATVVAATLTLLGLLIGFSFSMAISRYDQRKDYEEAEANAIGTEYMRAGLLPAAAIENVRGLLKKYADQRIRFYVERQEANLAKIDDDTVQLQGQMWSVVERVAGRQPTPVVALAVAGMNDVLNSQGYTQAAWRNRIPMAAWGLMATIAFGCCALVGYSAHEARTSALVILPVVLSTAFFLIADVDSPRHGIIRVTPQNLMTVSRTLAVP